MKKISFLIATLLLGGAPSLASETALQVIMKDGSKTYYVVSAKPSVTFSGDNMDIRTIDASVSMKRSDVASIRISEDVTSIIANPGDTQEFVGYTANRLTAPGKQIEVFTLDGRLAATGFESLSTEDFRPGVYAVRAGKQTLRIIIK